MKCGAVILHVAELWKEKTIDRFTKYQTWNQGQKVGCAEPPEFGNTDKTADQYSIPLHDGE